MLPGHLATSSMCSWDHRLLVHLTCALLFCSHTLFGAWMATVGIWVQSIAIRFDHAWESAT